jgi:hypothetical protein
VTARKPDLPQVALALALFALSWFLLHHGFYERDQIVDTPVYESYGEAIADGEVPYRDFRVEYPPGALPMFVLPALGDTDYRVAFEWLMALCGGGLVVAVALAARRLGLGFGTLAFVALSPLAIGSVILTRFDLWPRCLRRSHWPRCCTSDCVWVTCCSARRSRRSSIPRCSCR